MTGTTTALGAWFPVGCIARRVRHPSSAASRLGAMQATCAVFHHRFALPGNSWNKNVLIPTGGMCPNMPADKKRKESPMTEIGKNTIKASSGSIALFVFILSFFQCFATRIINWYRPESADFFGLFLSSAGKNSALFCIAPTFPPFGNIRPEGKDATPGVALKAA
ncbi:hypothetical protein [Shinella zoogloeoides]